MRKIRYRQVLRQRIGNTGGLYKTQVRLQQLFWNEDQAFAWTIPQVREIHSGIGTWDKLTKWNSVGWIRDRKGVLIPKKGVCNRIELPSLIIYPKANYKPIKYCHRESLNDMQRTLDFLEREGC